MKIHVLPLGEIFLGGFFNFQFWVSEQRRTAIFNAPDCFGIPLFGYAHRPPRNDGTAINHVNQANQVNLY